MEKDFTVRKATFLDIPRLVVMVCQLHEEESGKELTEAKERYIQAYIMHEFLGGNLGAVVAVATKHKKERVIGMTMFDIRMNPYGGEHSGLQGWGHHLYVDKEYRGGNVAHKLIEESENVARSLGVEEVFVETKIPILFTRLHGYEQVHVVLRKAL